MKFKKSALIIALSSLLTMNAHAELNVSTAQGFKDAYSKIQILIAQMYESQAASRPVFSIENFKDNGATSSFDDLFQMTLASPNIETKILGTNSQIQANHAASETNLAGPIHLFVKDNTKTYFEGLGEVKGSLTNAGVYTGQAAFKNLSHTENTDKTAPAVDVKVDEMSLTISGKVNDDISQFESVNFNYGLNGFSIEKAKSELTEAESFALKQASYQADLKPTQFAGLFSGTGLVNLKNMTFNIGTKGISLDSIEINAGMNVTDNLFDVMLQANLIKPVAMQDNLLSNWGDATINMSFKGIDAQGYALFQSKANTLTDPNEIRSLMAGILSKNLQFDFDAKSILAGQTASFAMNFKPTPALVDLARSNTPMPQFSLADIEKYVDTLTLSFTLPKTYFIEQGLNIERLRPGFDSNVAEKRLEGAFLQATAMAAVIIPTQFQPIIKLENDVVTFNLSYKDNILNINGNQMTIADALRALGQK